VRFYLVTEASSILFIASIGYSRPSGRQPALGHGLLHAIVTVWWIAHRHGELPRPGAVHRRVERRFASIGEPSSPSLGADARRRDRDAHRRAVRMFIRVFSIWGAGFCRVCRRRLPPFPGGFQPVHRCRRRRFRARLPVLGPVAQLHHLGRPIRPCQLIAVGMPAPAAGMDAQIAQLFQGPQRRPNGTHAKADKLGYRLDCRPCAPARGVGPPAFQGNGDATGSGCERVIADDQLPPLVAIRGGAHDRTRALRSSPASKSHSISAKITFCASSMRATSASAKSGNQMDGTCLTIQSAKRNISLDRETGPR